MKRSFLFVFALLVAPTPATAQVTIGMDAGFTFSGILQDPTTLTAVNVPTGSIRLGSARSSPSLDVLASFDLLHSSGNTFSVLNLSPGVVVPFGDGGGYVRPEVLLSIASGGGNTDGEFGIGVAVGTTSQVGDGPFSVRLEAGFDRWVGDRDLNQLRATVGLSAPIG